MKLLRYLDKAVFGWGSPVTFGVIRMVYGFLALVNFLMISLDFDAWYTEKGFVPVAHAEIWSQTGSPTPVWRFNLLANVTDSRITLAVYILTIVAAFLTMIGLWSRVSSIALAALLVTLHHRDPMILHSGDTLMRQFCILIALSPSGASCSVDRLIRLWKGKAPAEPSPVSLWPLRLMQFEVALLYLTTVWHKWGGSHWRDGTAFYYLGELHEFDRFPTPAFFHTQPFIGFATYATLIIEIAMGTLVFSKLLRKWAIFGGIFLHVLIEYSANIPLFEWIMMGTYLSFFYGEEVTAWAHRVGSRLKMWHVRVALPAGQALSPSRGAFLRATDAFGVVEFVEGDGDWAATQEGRAVDPYGTTLRAAIGLWALKLVPGVWKRLVNGSTVPKSASSAAEARAATVSPRKA